MALISIDCLENAGDYNTFGETRNIMCEVALCVILKHLVCSSVFMNLKLQICQLVRYPKITLTFES